MSDHYNWHGLLLADKALPPPTCVFRTTALARADTGTNIDGSEYQDSPEVLDVKADKFIELCRASRSPAILSGAGLSTASGIRDYASNKSGTAQQGENRLTYDFIFSCRPTVAHRVLAEMGRRNILKPSPYNWVQQNHDGLELRAGWPVMSNLIRGQWLDTWEIAKKDNQVVPMSGNLRSDLFEHLLNLEKTMDFCVSIGTSNSGLNVDRLVKTSGTRFAHQGKGLGLAMLTIQKTPYDHLAALRIFSKCDEFMMIVAKKLGLRINLDVDYDSVKRTPIEYRPSKRTETMTAFARNPLYGDVIVNAAASGAPIGAVPPKANPPAAAIASSSPQQPRSLMTGDRATPKDRTPPTSPPLPAPAPPASSENTSSAPNPTRLQIQVGNYHHQVEGDGGSDQNRHRWTVFVASNIPKSIESVTFQLHPTFSPSTVRVNEPVKQHQGPGEEFQLTRLGWGTFSIGIDIVLRGGKTLRTSHELSFVQPETSTELKCD